MATCLQREMLSPTICLRDAIGAALEHRLEEDDRVILLGEDIVDPYGGAFKVTRGLSTRYPERVRSCPVSEPSMLGLASGMALAGMLPIVEIMFADFLTLGFDQIFNHAAKFSRMYAPEVRCPLLVRTAAGAGRGYGPTHSQSPEKFFLGVPGLTVASAGLHADPLGILRDLQDREGPSLWIEPKVLYERKVQTSNDLLEFGWIVDEFELGGLPARTIAPVPAEECFIAVVAYGAMAHALEDVVWKLAISHELFCSLTCVTALNTIDLDPLWSRLGGIERLVFAEEGTGGWGWGGELAWRAQCAIGDHLTAAPFSLASRADVIPCGRVREQETVLSAAAVGRKLAEIGGCQVCVGAL